MTTTPRLCNVDGCEKTHHANGYCRSHWRTDSKYGTPTPTAEQRKAMRKPPEPKAPKPVVLCRVPGCGRVARLKAKRLCQTHRMREYISGDVREHEPVRQVNRDPFARMADRLEPGEYGCWLWTGRTDKDGYGLIDLPGRSPQRVHRVSYELFTGQELTPDIEVDHICQVRRCANPAHAQPVTGPEHDGITSQRRKMSKADGVIFVPERHTINATQLMFGWEHGLPVEFGGAAFIPPLSD